MRIGDTTVGLYHINGKWYSGMRNLFRYIILLTATLFVGALSGWICGFIIIAFGHYIGRSGTTGTQYFGYWDPKSAWGLSEWYGKPLGQLMAPIGYFIFLQRTSLIRAWCVTMLGTISGGLLGALVGPPLAVLTGCIGFFTACYYAGRSKN
jgi:hypothetical protein